MAPTPLPWATGTVVVSWATAGFQVASSSPNPPGSGSVRHGSNASMILGRHLRMTSWGSKPIHVCVSWTGSPGV